MPTSGMAAPPTATPPVIALTSNSIVNFSATQAFSLSGTVTGTGGAPLPAAYVVIYPAASPTWVTTVAVNGSGAYAVTLPTGNYKVRVQPNTAGYADFWYGGTAYGDATVIALTSNSIVDSSATQAFSLSGTVTGTGGAPLPAAYVVIYQAASPTWVTTVAVNGSGAYAVTLPTGNYKVRVQPNTAGYADFWYGGTAYGDATVIALTSNSIVDSSATES